jgi:hypothetical protein
MDRSWPDGPFSHADLTRLGLTAVDLRRGQRRAEVRQVVRGVWVAAGVPDSHELRVSAVARVVPPHHVVTDRTAAWLHGVDSFEHAGAVREVEVCALRGHEPTALTGADGRTRDLLSVDVMELDGVRITTPLRTGLDLGSCLRRREAYAALNAIARAHDLTGADYARSLGRFRRRRGVVQLRDLVPLVDPRIESQRESWVALAIHDDGLPPPEPQVWVEADGVPVFRLDHAYRHHRVCVEYDGREWHGTREQREHDDVRRTWLREHGWTVIVVRSGDFTGAALDRWLRELRAALQSGYANRRW